MSCQRNTSRVAVPDDLRDILLEFTISYLIEQPGDIIDYAVDFFTRLKENRNNQLNQSGPEGSITPDDTAEDEPPKVSINRRKSVFAETYDPADDDEDERPTKIHPKSDEQRKRLSDSVRNILLFRALDKEQMSHVLDAMFEKNVQPGELIIRQGDDGDNFYIIEKGRFEVYVKDALIHTYDNNGAFGELALLYNMPRAATVKAITPGTLWAMDRQTFRRILLKSAYNKCTLYEDLINKVPMLKSLEPFERMNLADALIPKTFSDGDQIIKQGDEADGMYFVEQGIVKITIMDDHGREVEVNKIPAGGYIGELALVTHKPRAASAYAIGNVKLAFLHVEAFERLLGPCMELMMRNADDYEGQLIKIFGSKTELSDFR